MDHCCWFLLGSWNYAPTVWRESKIWDSLCQHLSDQSQSCGFLFCLNPRRFPWWIHRNALGSRLEPGFLQPAEHFSHLTVPSEESAQHRQQARRADGINRGFLPARKQMLVLEMKYCHGKDSWGHPCCSSELAGNWAGSKGLGTQSRNQIPPQNWERNSWWPPRHTAGNLKKIQIFTLKTAGLVSSCRPQGPQQKDRSFMGSGPKLPKVLVPGGEVLPWAMGNAECWIQSQELLEPRVPKSPLPKQPPLGRSRWKATPLKQ